MRSYSKQMYQVHDAHDIALTAAQHLSADPFERTRKRDNVYARRMVIAYLREKGFVLTKIGFIFELDHSTVIHNIKEHEAMMSLSHFNSYKPYCAEYYRMWNAMEFREANTPTFGKERMRNAAWML